MLTPPSGRTLAVVVGGGGEIGRAIARRLAATHRIAILDRDSDRVEGTVALLPSDTVGFVVDAGDAAKVDLAFSALVDLGPLSMVAIAVGTTEGVSLVDMRTDEWSRVLVSNLTSVATTLRASIARMMDQGSRGAICIIGSVHASAPVPGFPAYAAAKAGVRALAMQAAGEYGHLGIRINVVMPGWTRTAHTSARIEQTDIAALLDATPLRQLVEPDDVAASAIFLLSDDARLVTGAELVVDGGASLLSASVVLRQGPRALLGLEHS